jgi:subtilisin family serine protease
VYPLRIYKPLLTPNDPNQAQWWTTSTGLESAWGIGAGSRQTTVAVIDTGFGLKHEELAGRWLANTGEQGPTASEAASQLNCTDRGVALDESCNLIDDDHDGIVDNETGATTEQDPSRLNCTDLGRALDKSCNRLDDDDNGFIDDVTGWDFVNEDNNVQAGEVNPNGPETTHATEVSGVLAATGNNGKGIAGVDWSTKILPLQAIDDDGYGDTLTVANAVEYAANRGADVISLSLGADAEDPYLRQVIDYALDKGSIVVAASGNDGCDCISYPARYPEVVAVGAESSTGSPASFSSYGSSLDILAPGTDITTSIWNASNPTSAYVSGVAGTSFATPYVSGLLSLARSHQPAASWGELLNALLAQADHTGLSVSSPVSSTLGFGLAHADRFISRITTAKSPALRYEFSPLSATDTLGSSRAYQCEGGDFPTSAVYELTRGSSVRYTISPLEEIRAAADGWLTKQLWYTCVGLPGDTPATVRSINLLSEVRNSPTTKPAAAN